MAIWGQAINALIGIWLMAAPDILRYGVPALTNDRIVGPIAATFAIVSWWEATRAVRRVNLVVGVWLLIAPWLLGYHELIAIVNSIICGIALASLSFTGSKIKQQFGGGWISLWPPKKIKPGQHAVYGNREDWFR